MVNRQRLSDEFARLAAITSPPLREGAIARYLAERLAALGADILFDRADQAVGGEIGNLIAWLPAAGKESEPLLMSVHMDTVEPGGEVVPVLNDGVFTSASGTILGADDKAGIAELIEALEVIRERQIPRGPVEVVVTIAEEIGLVGAKHLDYTLLRSRYGYALDTTGVGHMVLRAPAANRLRVEITGRESHAGVAPELGVSAIRTAALALAEMRLGRIDAETTANFGRIEGGVACNIIPGRVSLEGEARSHDPDKLRVQTEHMVACFERAVAAMTTTIAGEQVRPELHIDIEADYPRMAVAEDAPVVRLAQAAAAAAGQALEIRLGGGGSDANILNAHGIETIILATGMRDVHSPKESVTVDDMAAVAELLVEIIRNA
ncbi:MAG: M20/M25/M40 family metallo-hydrolase [Deltaproteobacteria bacterium]|nr:MAG: M20/M25/M40 family metallo-hydrolase [Deltaproteobacteria bacterium]